MTEHWQFWHSNDYTEWRCKICRKIFSKKRNIDRHLMEVHRTEGHFICEECPASYTRKENLKQHITSGIHWKHVYCIKCEQVLKFDTKFLRNSHCSDHGMPEKIVEFDPNETPEDTHDFPPSHVRGVYCEDLTKCYVCRKHPWLKKHYSKN